MSIFKKILLVAGTVALMIASTGTSHAHQTHIHHKHSTDNSAAVGAIIVGGIVAAIIGGAIIGSAIENQEHPQTHPPQRHPEVTTRPSPFGTRYWDYDVEYSPRAFSGWYRGNYVYNLHWTAGGFHYKFCDLESNRQIRSCY